MTTRVVALEMKNCGQLGIYFESTQSPNYDGST